MNWTQCVAEYIGTFVFVLTVMISRNPIVIGLMLEVILMALGSYSKQSVNPCVSLAYFLNDDLSMSEMLAYIIGQMVAAALAFYTYKHLYPKIRSSYSVGG